MPNYTKAQLAEKLRKAGVTPPPLETTSARALSDLLDRVNKLPRVAPGRPPQGRAVPQAPAARPRLTTTPAVPPPPPVAVAARSEHDLRPHDPFAGW